jgi:hypothetical protein
MKDTEVDGTYNRLFVGEIENVIKCTKVQYESNRVESFANL